jgi:hypothetical protein
VSGNLIEGDAIAWIEFFNQNAGPDTPYNLYIGPLTHRILGTATESFSEPMSLTRASSQTEGIDDTWWALYGITGSNRLAADDPDGDGFSNAQENALGTSPVDASSTFKVGTIDRTGNTLSITWPSIAGKKYQVQKRASLSSGDWVDSGSQVTASGTSSSANVDVSDSPNASFVRVILVP